MYCSRKCTKRAWYIKRHPNSFYAKNNKEFWKSATGKGFKWEKFVSELLGAKHLIFNHSGPDLLLDNKYIDVKVSKINRRKFKRGISVKSKQQGTWNFRLGRCKPDFYFFVCLDDNENIKKMLMIPFEEIDATSGCVIGKKSKYDNFKYTK